MNNCVQIMNARLDVHCMNTLEVPPEWGGRGVPASVRPSEDERVVLSLLESVEQDGATSQRRLAAELGIAVGLVNAYLNRCIQKGLVKVSQAPARRYAYYLTPQGFIEKSRLSLEYLAYSFKFFRQAKLDCQNAFEDARARGFTRIALNGVSDIAEIATICAREAGIEIVAIVDQQSSLDRFSGLPITATYEAIVDQVDAVIITDIRNTKARAAAARAHFGDDQVLVPSLLQKASGADIGGPVGR